VKKGHVEHTAHGPKSTSQYEHSSIIATVKKIFGLKGFLTKRDAWAGTFDHLFKMLKKPRTDCPRKLPAVSRPPPTTASGNPMVTSSNGDERQAKAERTKVNHLQCHVLETYKEFKDGDCKKVTEAEAFRLVKKWQSERDGKRKKQLKKPVKTTPVA